MNHAYRSYVVACSAKKQNEGEKRVQKREVARVRDYCINQSYQWGYRLARPLVQTPRERSIFSPNPLPSLFSRPVGSLSLLYFSFHCDLSLLLSLFLTRTRVLFTQPPLPPFLSFARARSPARVFLGGEGARPGGDG